MMEIGIYIYTVWVGESMGDGEWILLSIRVCNEDVYFGVGVWVSG